jgi:hypothetical protein
VFQPGDLGVAVVGGCGDEDVGLGEVYAGILWGAASSEVNVQRAEIRQVHPHASSARP